MAGTSYSRTGIKELDSKLGGGYRKGSTVLVSGPTGSGKTISSFQWLFEGYEDGENGVYITLTEPLFRTLEDLETLEFYEREAIEGQHIKVVDLREETEIEESIFGHDVKFRKILDFIEREVKDTGAKRLCIDSITALAYSMGSESKVRRFIFELGKLLSTLGCTTVLTSEISGNEELSAFGVEEFISDVVLRLDYSEHGKTPIRRLFVIKARGTDYRRETLYFTITPEGLMVFPSIDVREDYPSSGRRVSTGMPGLDELMQGGVFEGTSMLIAGGPGTGKTIFSVHFLMEALEQGKNCVFVSGEETRSQLDLYGEAFGWDLKKYIDNGQLSYLCIHPERQLFEEEMKAIMDAVERNDVERVVVDSLNALSHSSGAEDFPTFVRLLNDYLKMNNITSLYTLSRSESGFPASGGLNISSISDAIVRMQHVEIESSFRRVLNILKMRGSGHSKDIYMYDITSDGVQFGASLQGYEGITSGITHKVGGTVEEKLLSELLYFLGPVAYHVVEEIKKEGLDQETVMEKLRELVEGGALDEEDFEELREHIGHIFTYKLSEEDLAEFFG